MEYQSPPQMVDSTRKCREYVATRRMKRSSWRAAKAAFVAISRVGVGPGVKMEFQSSSRKEAMIQVMILDLLLRSPCCAVPKVKDANCCPAPGVMTNWVFHFRLHRYRAFCRQMSGDCQRTDVPLYLGAISLENAELQRWHGMRWPG